MLFTLCTVVPKDSVSSAVVRACRLFEAAVAVAASMTAAVAVTLMLAGSMLRMTDEAGTPEPTLAAYPALNLA